MAKKKTTTRRGRKPNADKLSDEEKSESKKKAQNLDGFDRESIIKKFLQKADEPGITGVQATKELRSMLAEEKPNDDLVISFSFVPIVFDDEKFIGLLSEAEEV